jgi:hypothetical protein
VIDQPKQITVESPTKRPAVTTAVSSAAKCQAGTKRLNAISQFDDDDFRISQAEWLESFRIQDFLFHHGKSPNAVKMENLQKNTSVGENKRRKQMQKRRLQPSPDVTTMRKRATAHIKRFKWTNSKQDNEHAQGFDATRNEVFEAWVRKHGPPIRSNGPLKVRSGFQFFNQYELERVLQYLNDDPLRTVESCASLEELPGEYNEHSVWTIQTTQEFQQKWLMRWWTNYVVPRKKRKLHPYHLIYTSIAK